MPSVLRQSATVLAAMILLSCATLPAAAPTATFAPKQRPIPTSTPTSEPSDALDRYDFEFIEAFGGHEWDRPTDIAFLPDGESALDS